MQTELVIQHPEATMPLRVKLTVDCNTPDEKILANVLKNSRHIKKWAKTLPAHERTAILVGGGPSLIDSVEDIRAMDGDIFALNGAAGYLHKNAILADYQVIMDAQPRTIELIGPAKNYLFASQVDPSLFRKKPNAVLWHATHGDVMVDEQDGFPEHHDDYCMIGGAVSVGNTALILLYALGYRSFQIFGMDSSHRGSAGHAYRQDMNDGDPCMTVEYNGRTFVCSISMELQARHFMNRVQHLIAADCKVEVHGDGLLPEMFNRPMSEVDKYRSIWAKPEYRACSPGENSAEKFLERVKPLKGRLIADFGCGTGRGGLAIHNAGYNVRLVDFADNCRDEAAAHLPFLCADLTKPIHIGVDYGYCTDVLEHIPTEDVSLVVSNIMSAATVVYFQISTTHDTMGCLIGQPLHLTVKPHEWWMSLFHKLGYRVTWDECEPHQSTFIVKREMAA